jgi:nucleoside-diphosphate-sugar epimerase
VVVVQMNGLGLSLCFGDVAVDCGLEVESSNVLPALIRKVHEATISGAASMKIWGSGTPRREFVHLDECADALVKLMKVCFDNTLIRERLGWAPSIALKHGLEKTNAWIYDRMTKQKVAA